MQGLMGHDHARDAFVPPLSAQDVVDLLLVDWHRERPDLDATGMAVIGRICMGQLLEAQVNDELRPPWRPLYRAGRAGHLASIRQAISTDPDRTPAISAGD
ncbi:hypothetical protein H9L17_15020 [Thermomonas brevis]|uniref:Uncharacterized protein n=1 Tax=Thermomonas brevis TaxID=215691 RepID=A0A7G9QSX9_9GAMM|nr:hypothetical protein [Thermomonas brevis]QNN46454.1 hypothetical protein H9L17_15020 [Thermomonas brevis]